MADIPANLLLVVLVLVIAFLRAGFEDEDNPASFYGVNTPLFAVVKSDSVFMARK